MKVRNAFQVRPERKPMLWRKAEGKATPNWGTRWILGSQTARLRSWEFQKRTFRMTIRTCLSSVPGDNVGPFISFLGTAESPARCKAAWSAWGCSPNPLRMGIGTWVQPWASLALFYLPYAKRLSLW